MKLLISIKDINEVEDAVTGGADIIDIKDPNSSSLGLPDLCVVREVVDIVKSRWDKELSIALGDITKEDKSLKYTVFVGGILGVDYVKIGIATNDFDIATKIAKDAVEVLNSFNKTKLVLVGYADFMYVDTLEPLKIVDIAVETGARGVMIDTLRKNSVSTFDILSATYLQSFVRKARDGDLLVAIAGGIKLVHLPLCVSLGFDVVGVRGAVCKGGRGDKISRELVALFRNKLSELIENRIRKGCAMVG